MEAAAYPGFPEYAGYSGGGGGSGSVTWSSSDPHVVADGLANDEKRNRRQPRTDGLLFRLMTVFEPSTNRLSMKIYGSKKAVHKERLRQRSLGVWVIHPCSKFRYVLVIGLSRVYSIFVLEIGSVKIK